MRGIPSFITQIRKRVFTEVAQMAYEGDYERMELLPYTIIPGEVAEHRESIFLERAIVGERIRLAMGLPLRSVREHSLLSDGVTESAVAEKYYDPPLINIISFACNACPQTQYRVTDCCQGCLAQNCHQVCPKDAVRFSHGRAVIDREKCIQCGRCEEACAYHAIVKLERPCVAACGMDAIGMDENGKAQIDQSKCVSCGQCLVSCPFGAIVDKGQIFQVIHAFRQNTPVVALIAPAFVGQFGPLMTPQRLTTAMKKLGFSDVVEVAIGADICTVDEAEEFIERVPGKQPYMGTSCCPAWISMVDVYYPDQTENISMTLTPMVLTARMVKKENPNCKIAFIGPCAAKKLEASREHIRSDVDFVLTFEELQGMFDAKGIVFAELADSEPAQSGTQDGRGFAVSGGVASAVKNVINRMHPEREVKIMQAEGLRECRKMLQMAKAGKLDGYLLEGMACPGGCVAGAGTCVPVKKAAAQVGLYKKTAQLSKAEDSPYLDMTKLLKD